MPKPDRTSQLMAALNAAVRAAQHEVDPSRDEVRQIEEMLRSLNSFYAHRFLRSRGEAA